MKKLVCLLITLIMVIGMVPPVFAADTAIRYNDNYSEIEYSSSGWTYWKDPEFYCGDEHYSNQTGASATFSFTGTSICYIGAKSDNLGTCDIYIDGELKVEGLDAYAPTLQPKQCLFFAEGLSDGEHTITIDVTGDSNPNAVGCYVTIDAFEVNGDGPMVIDTSELEKIIALAKSLNGGDYTSESWNALQAELALAEALLSSPVKQGDINNEVILMQEALDGLQFLTDERIYNDTDPSVRYEGTWVYYEGPEGFYDDDEHYSNQTGAYAEVTFVGTNVTYIATKSVNLGICDIYLDSEFKESIDAYAPTLLPQQELFRIDGLELGRHTLRIVVKGERNPAATENHVTIDAFRVMAEDETDPDPVDPIDPMPPFEATHLAPGNYYSIAVNSNGELYSWGYGAHYALGNGSEADHERPKRVMSNFTVKTVAVGYIHSLAVTGDGSLYAWGWNNYGQLGNGAATQYLKTPTKIMGNVKVVAAKENHSFAITEDGTLYGWGDNQYGQLGDGTTTGRGKPTKIMENVRCVSTSWYHTFAITEDGTLYAWGNNSNGKLGDGSTTSIKAPKKIMDNVISAAAGRYSSHAISKDGTLYGWGGSVNGSLGLGASSNILNPTKIMDNMKFVSNGDTHSLAITKDGTLYAWGSNSYNELGDGTSKSKNMPVKIIDNVKSAAAGYSHSLAISEDGTLYGWGRNTYAQLGLGDQSNRKSPTRIM